MNPEPNNASAADRERFARQLTERNLRHAWWLSIVLGAFAAAVTAYNLIRPLPLSEVVTLNAAFELICVLASLGLIRWFRTRTVNPRWPRAFVAIIATIGVVGTTVYYFTTLSAYGQNSTYVLGALVISVLLLLPPRTLLTLLLGNHIVFIALVLREGDPTLVMSAAIDGTTGVLIAGLAGWFLYRAHWDNFCQQRVIELRTDELHARNTELARLHRLELDQKISAQLAEEKAQLEVLRYQLNPHFLYNTLNSLYSLVVLQPEAGAMVLRLSEFCRFTLTRGSEFQSVAAEFATLRAYLDIEQFRWGEKLTVTISATPAAAPQPLPPFLLLPLVENAIKHGLATSRTRLEVRIGARVGDDGQLAIEVANTGRWSASPAESVVSTSIGLENLRRRLRRYYPNAHAFTIGQDGDWVVAKLHLTQGKVDPTQTVDRKTGDC